MSFRLFDAPLAEPSQFVGFAGNRVDRQSENRSDDSVDMALADPSARLLLMGGGRIRLRLANGSFDARFTLAEASALGADLGSAVLLGHAPDGRPLLAAPADGDPEGGPEGIKAIDYRSAYTQGLLDAEGLGELAQGASLLAWHASHRFCGRCGQPTRMRAGGYKRLCGGCGAELFPRTDPVAIMLTVTMEKCLLGRGRHFLPGMYSALAGFIEPGETIENAVRRETFEEAGIRLGRVVYHASQPWPFPYSLMIGCFGEPLDDEVRADQNELEDCRWFQRDEVAAMLERTHPDGLVVPPPGAIAHHLIRAWAESG
jgi:NAD+ diphosphatase